MPHRAEVLAVTDHEKIQLLIDRMDISEVIHHYPMSIDSRSWPLFRSIFTEEIEVCLGNATEQARFRRVGAARFTERVASMIGGFAVTQHFLTDYHIEVNGDSAVCVCYMQARHFNPDGQGGQAIWDIGGYYRYNLIRTGRGWKIPKYHLAITWEQNRPPGLKI
jgi:SnoaL-like domain